MRKESMHLLVDGNRTACGRPYSAWSYSMFVDREEGQHITCQTCRASFITEEKIALRQKAEDAKREKRNARRNTGS